MSDQETTDAMLDHVTVYLLIDRGTLPLTARSWVNNGIHWDGSERERAKLERARHDAAVALAAMQSFPQEATHAR